MIIKRQKTFYLVSSLPDLDRKILKPEKPKSLLALRGYMENKRPRIELYRTVDDALSVYLGGARMVDQDLYVYKALGLRDDNLLEVSGREVPYAWEVPEWWYMIDLRVQALGKIKVLGVESEIPFQYGPRGTRGVLYRYKWEEIKKLWERSKIFSKTSDNLKKNAKRLLAAGSIIGGYKLIKSANKDGELTGRVNLYHGTKTKNVEDIKNQGLLASHAKDKDTLLKKTYGKDYIEDDNNVYLSRNKNLAEEVNAARYIRSLPKKEQEDAEWKLGCGDDNKYEKGLKDSQTILDLDMSRSDFKKLGNSKNPELLGAKNKFDFTRKYNKINKDRIKRNGGDTGWVGNTLRTPILMSAYDDFNNKTVTTSEDIDPKFIKGSKKYRNKSRVEDFKNNIKENPSDFLLGAGKVLGGSALIALGGKSLLKHNKL